MPDSTATDVKTTWKTGDEQPADLKHVIDKDNLSWVPLRPDIWRCIAVPASRGPESWEELLHYYGPVRAGGTPPVAAALSDRHVQSIAADLNTQWGPCEDPDCADDGRCREPAVRAVLEAAARRGLLR